MLPSDKENRFPESCFTAPFVNNDNGDPEDNA